MIDQDSVAIVLAAGRGTRMKSDRPKVLHEVAGRAMLGHVLAAADEAGIKRRVVVTGPGDDAVAALAMEGGGEARTVVQQERRGTGHAVMTARAEMFDDASRIFILFGDTPLIRAETIEVAGRALDEGDIAVLAFTPDDPTGYGRLVTDSGGQLLAIREHIDASEEERRITSCFSGLMAFRDASTLGLLDEIAPDNAKGEIYLTDIVALARGHGLRIAIGEVDAVDVQGVNSRADLAEAEAAMQARLRARALDAGATLIDPQSVYLSHDTVIGRDVVIEPNVWIAAGVSIGDGVLVRAFSHLEGAHVEAGARIGPFARLRPGAEVGADAHVGNFVELKNANLGPGAKVNHLTYVGDASVGAGSNVGAGTITCNYDGFAKHRTEIGAGAFIGSNSALVAPVKVGAGAYVATGSVVTMDVPEDALAVARVRQENKPGWAERFRQKFSRKRART